MFLRYGFIVASLAFPLVGHSAGSNFKIKSLVEQAPNTPYVGVGQITREQRFTGEGPVTFIDYELNGVPRRLWDDDGFATLFIYQRSLVSRAIDNNFQQGRYASDHLQPGIDTDNFSHLSPLPKPISPLIKSIERLESYYKKLKDEDVRVKTDPELKQTYDALIKRISDVSTYMKSSKFQSVKDIKESGLESLLSDLESNHAYNVETDKDEMVNDSIGNLIGQGIPQNFGDPVYARCFDEVELTWITAAKKFSASSKGGGAGSDADTHMELKDVDTGN